MHYKKFHLYYYFTVFRHVFDMFEKHNEVRMRDSIRNDYFKLNGNRNETS